MLKPDQVIYLDHNATTGVDPAVFEEMRPFLTDFYGNPSSHYTFGAQVKKSIERAREQVAALMGCSPDEIIFTGCGTESNNTAVESALRVTHGRHMVTTRVEHSALVKHGAALEQRGVAVSYVGVDADGRLDMDEMKKSVRQNTGIVSVMWANNETGVIFPVEEIAAFCREQKKLFHTDAVQAVGKIPMNLAASSIAMLSLSGHKLHAPKGVGALFIQEKTKFSPFMIGGGQEKGRRGGTENVASIVGLGKAAELAQSRIEDEVAHVSTLRDSLEKSLIESVSGTRINGAGADRLPNTTSVSFDGVEADALLKGLDECGICASSGSACTSGAQGPSHVLSAMGIPSAMARGSLRFSFGSSNTAEDVATVLRELPRIVDECRRYGQRS